MSVLYVSLHAAGSEERESMCQEWPGMHTNHVRTVVLVIRFAKLALHTRLNLGPDTDTLSNIEICYLLANCNDFPDDFMANTERGN